MKPPVSVTKETKLEAALEKMLARGVSELPVVDADGRVIGDLNAFELLKHM
ncbi:MAG: CBS domain-containing protein [Bacillota bacterium]